jgi:hypothetical protein
MHLLMKHDVAVAGAGAVLGAISAMATLAQP